MDAHLVLDAVAADAVARTQRAVGIDEELGHHEQRNPLGAGRRIGQARKHQMHDVLDHVVLARADENLLARELVAAVGLRFGLAAQQTEVGAAMRLGQAHGAGPFARGQLGQIGLLERVGAVREQAFVSAVRQARIHEPGLVGRIAHFIERGVGHLRQPLPAEVGLAAERRPAAFDELGIGLFVALGRGHFEGGLVVMAAFFIARFVEREDDVFAKLGAFFEHRIERVAIDLGVLGQSLEGRFDIEQFVQHEMHVALRGLVDGHGGLREPLMLEGWNQAARRMRRAVEEASDAAPRPARAGGASSKR